MPSKKTTKTTPTLKNTALREFVKTHQHHKPYAKRHINKQTGAVTTECKLTLRFEEDTERGAVLMQVYGRTTLHPTDKDDRAKGYQSAYNIALENLAAALKQQ